MAVRLGPRDRRLVRADQVALRVLWQAPDRALQTIVGRRHERKLPTNIRYHIDHLSLILDNFGDRIRMGEGEEVRNVLHPAAPGALRFYDYRLADSLEIRIRDQSTRVYRLDVRPAETEIPSAAAQDRAAGDAVLLYTGYLKAGGRMIAVINGIEYEPGDVIEPGRYVVREITDQQVVIEERGGKALVLPLDNRM